MELVPLASPTWNTKLNAASSRVALWSVCALCEPYAPLHAFRHLLLFQSCSWTIGVTILSLEIKIFAHLFGRVPWTHCHDPHAVYILSSNQNPKTSRVLRLMYCLVTNGETVYIYTHTQQIFSSKQGYLRTKGRKILYLDSVEQNYICWYTQNERTTFKIDFVS